MKGEISEGTAQRRAWLGLRGKFLNHAIATLAGIGFLLFGYDQGVMGGLLTLPTFQQQFPSIDTKKNPQNSTLQGAAVALYEIGCFFGALACLYVGDKLGRRKTIFIGAWIMIVGAALQCSSFSLAQFIIGRIVTGIGNGLNTATVPTWQSECSKAHRRGALVMVEGALITGGICISYWVDFGFYWIKDNSVNWRGPLAIQIIFAIVLVCFVLSLPESPRWLMKVGRVDEAREVLAALDDCDPYDPYVSADIEEIQATMQLEDQSVGVKALFQNGKERTFHRAALGFVNQMFQQITGINLITYYAETLYETNLNLSATLSRILAAANGTEYFAASWIAVFTVEKVGRRKLMLFGATGQALTMAILAGTAAHASNHSAAIAAAVFLFVFNTFFAIGWLGMTWLYPAEINPLRTRAAANGVSTMANWIFNFMVVMITPVSFANIGYKTYIVFAVLNAAMVPSVYFFFPETAGRSLEEIDDIFKDATVFNVVWKEKKTPRKHIGVKQTPEVLAEKGGLRKSGDSFDRHVEHPHDGDSNTTAT